MKRAVQLAIIVIVVCTLLPLEVLAAAPLKVGAHGWKVKIAQQKLNVVGISTDVNGKFTKNTERALKEFQKKYKIKITGWLDDKTYDRIINEAFTKEGIHGVTGKQIVSAAAKLKGVPYKFGGKTVKGFDCSGYVQHIFGKFKAPLPRLADEQVAEGIFVLRKNLREGDLVFFSTYEQGASHVGIYAGKGQFWHVSSTKGVMLSSLSEEYWAPRYYGARRVLADFAK
ncbi:MAG TPA: C40 family peptidase [Candidatus Avacidaminococcus intestinavium]|uniref:C40 family peptidase n=1 Tax=Candidatus Avacidaminococcus intestinavium TaxID=2840684 RepID=A0A9D1MQL3_9FIRM|nr:C40 family peptidase [Candidatus Avacidaminococcus intestinavium]